VDDVALGRERPGVDRLGPYRLVERVGAGGMGAVYRAVHEKVGRAMAVKLLHRSLRSESVAVSRFFQEARAVNTIRHPNVVEIHDLSFEGEDLYMVLELLRGRDLRVALDAEPQHRLPPERVVFILEQVCGALQAAHTRQIVHRDLKPENVFLVERQMRTDFVKLLDFGVAKLERPEGRLTREGIALGTPEYMAPEQARGAEVDGRTDLYAVGCIGYEMLTGRTVFEGKSPGDVMVKQVKAPPEPLRKWNPHVPEALEAVILRCLAKAPGGRPATGLDLAQELCASIRMPFDTSGAFMRWRTWDGSSTVSSLVDVPLEIRSNASKPLSLSAKTRMLLRRRRPLVGVAAMAAVVVAVLAWWGLRPGGSKTGELPLPATAMAGGPEVLPLGRVRLQSSPPEAEISDAQGRRLGLTPLDLTLPVGQTVTLRLKRDGYRPVERTVSADIDGRTVAVVLEPVLEPEKGTVSAPVSEGQPRARKPTRDSASRTRKKLDSNSLTINPF
jgi:eukaryotic-like serine/threonine-protein kinase